ncbi:MAG TPA: N,N-dimethylformamidase beta subunit family domain-containing protein, partial [Blastocatellia bacterium]
KFRNEQELMGATSYGVGAADWVCAKPDHWVFEGTGMKEGDAVARLVGWEYHGPPLRDNPRLIVLARGKVKVDNNPIEREYAATIYPGPKDNFVFNAGTCWWSMVISRPPGYKNSSKVEFQTDARVERMTKNILDQMIRRRQ